jgi:hypothetical protein
VDGFFSELLIVDRNRSLAQTDGMPALRGNLEQRLCRALTNHTNHTTKSKQAQQPKLSQNNDCQAKTLPSQHTSKPYEIRQGTSLPAPQTGHQANSHEPESESY